MGLKLNTSSGGSVSIEPTNTASNYTLTVPAQTGTVIASDASGNVGIGTASPSNKLDAYTATGGNVIRSQVGNADTAKFKAQNSVSSLDVGHDGSGGFIEQLGAYPIRFYSNNLERMRIDSSGNLLVGCTTIPSTAASTAYGVGFQKGISQTNVTTVTFRSDTSSNTEFSYFYNPNGLVGYIRLSGSSTSYVTSSDYRLKENIAPMTGALAKVQALKPCTYTWKADGSNGQGFIAHELAEVVPECVAGEKDETDEEGNPKYQGIDTSFLVATLTAAIQELKAVVDAQAERITALENK
jgi:hypothetical protein